MCLNTLQSSALSHHQTAQQSDFFFFFKIERKVFNYLLLMELSDWFLL